MINAMQKDYLIWLFPETLMIKESDNLIPRDTNLATPNQEC